MMAITEAAVHAFHLLHLAQLAQLGPSGASVPPKRRKSASGPSTSSKTRLRRPRASAPASLFPFVFRPTTIHLSVSAAPIPRSDRTTRRREGRDSLPSPSPPLEMDMEMEMEMDEGQASSSGSTSSASAAMPTSAPADPDEELYELDETRIESSPPLRSSPLAEKKKKKRKRDRASEAIRPPARGADEAGQSKVKKQKQKPKQKPVELPLPAPPLPGATTIDPRFLLLPSPSSHLSPVSGLASAFSGKKKKQHSQNGPSWVTQTPISSSQ